MIFLGYFATFHLYWEDLESKTHFRNTKSCRKKVFPYPISLHHQLTETLCAQWNWLGMNCEWVTHKSKLISRLMRHLVIHFQDEVLTGPMRCWFDFNKRAQEDKLASYQAGCRILCNSVFVLNVNEGSGGEKKAADLNKAELKACQCSGLKSC